MKAGGKFVTEQSSINYGGLERERVEEGGKGSRRGEERGEEGGEEERKEEEEGTLGKHSLQNLPPASYFLHLDTSSK